MQEDLEKPTTARPERRRSTRKTTPSTPSCGVHTKYGPTIPKKHKSAHSISQPDPKGHWTSSASPSDGRVGASPSSSRLAGCLRSQMDSKANILHLCSEPGYPTKLEEASSDRLLVQTTTSSPLLRRNSTFLDTHASVLSCATARRANIFQTFHSFARNGWNVWGRGLCARGFGNNCRRSVLSGVVSQSVDGCFFHRSLARVQEWTGNKLVRVPVFLRCHSSGVLELHFQSGSVPLMIDGPCFMH